MQKKSFSLIELLAVIAIIAILASIGLAAFGKAQMNAQVGATRALIKSLYVSLEAYNLEVGFYLPPEPNPNPISTSKLLTKDNLRKTFTYNDEDVDGGKLIDAFGTPLVYMYADVLGKSDLTHVIAIYSYGPDASSDNCTNDWNTNPGSDIDDIYIKDTD